MPESLPKTFNLALEQAKSRFRYAMYMVFGAYTPHGTEKPVIFPTERSAESDAAISELFNSGAPYYAEFLKEKLSDLQPYTKEYLEIEQELPIYNVAAEYIAGVKSRENSQILTINAFSEYVNEAKKYLENSHVSKEQFDSALKYIETFFHLVPKA